MTRPVRALGLALALSLAFALSGCGYGFTGGTVAQTEADTRLDPAFQQMAIARIENPTVEPWLEPRLRGLIRDEFTRRRLVTWVDRAKATSLLVVHIKQYTRSTQVSGQADQSLKLSTVITFSVRVHRASDNMLLWDSGEQSQGETFFPGDSDGADQRVTDMAIRRIADLLTQGY